MGYLGTEPGDDITINSHEYIAVANQTNFNVIYDEYVEVFFNGIQLSATEFTKIGNTHIILDIPAEVGDIIKVQGYEQYRDTNMVRKDELLTEIKKIDGTGSGLDADLLDGQTGTDFINVTNRLPDSGRFDGSTGSPGVTAGPATNQPWFGAYIGTTITYDDKIISNTSTYGGSNAALTAEAQGFVEYIGRAYRYQQEYYIAKMTTDTAATLIMDNTGGINRYLMTTSGSRQLSSTLMNKLSFWVKVNSGSFVTPYDNRGRTVISPSDGWQYVTTSTIAGTAYDNAYPKFSCEHNSVVLIALPCLYMSNVTMPTHSSPIPSI